MKRRYGMAILSCLLATVLLCGCAKVEAKGETMKNYYVSATEDFANVKSSDGNFKTITEALAKAEGGCTIHVLPGEYHELVNVTASGTEQTPITIIGEGTNDNMAVIDGTGVERPHEDDVALVQITNQSNIVLNNLEIRNLIAEEEEVVIGVLLSEADHNITVQNCKIHDIRTNYDAEEPNAHGLIARGNAKEAMTNITLLNNEVWDLQLGQSESVVLNGNVDGFVVRGNVIHDNDNIGLDFIGYEETLEGDEEHDRARNGVVENNTVYNISSRDNATYEGDCCADGIYVDGGSDIVIENNTVKNCDIGIEAASEHFEKAADNITIRGNKILECKEYTGLCIGGYDVDCGTARNIIIENNEVRDCAESLVIQQAEDSELHIKDNHFWQGDTEDTRDPYSMHMVEE